MLKRENTKLNGVILLKPDSFEDHRGEYLQIYNEKEYKRLIPEIKDINFVEEDISIATKYVIKGLHGNDSTWKLISCLYGKFYLVVANPKTYQWQAFTLSDINKYQVLIPPGYGNGHMCMSEKSIYHYKQSDYYNLDNQFTIRWNDEHFKIWWPMKTPILSQRDESGDKTYVAK